MDRFKKQLGFVLPLAILIAVVLIVGGAVGYYSYKTSQELEEISKGLKIVKPEQVIDETADWETYKNEKYGFILKFPESWAGFEVHEWKVNQDPGRMPPYFDTIEFKIDRTQDDGKEYYFSIRIHAHSHDQWAVRRLGQQTKKYSFISASHLPYPYLGENKDYVFCWGTSRGILSPEVIQKDLAEDILQLRTKEAESIISTFKIINPIKKSAEWKNYFNPGECKAFGENDYTNECYLESLTDLTEVEMCKKVRPDYRDFCYFQVAQNLKDSLICENLSTLINQESCYLNVALSLKKASICKNIPTEQWRNMCYGDVAEMLKDPSICEEIENPKAKGYCLMGANPEQPELPIPPISEWKTYTNEKHKYSFKHPPKWDFQVSFTSPETSELRVIREMISNQTATHRWRWFVVISAWDNPSELSLIDWLKFRGEPGGLVPEDMPFLTNTFVGEEKIEALQLWQGGTSTWDKPGRALMSYPYLEVYFVYKDKGYRATLNYTGDVDQESQKVFEQILSTFKFIEKGPYIKILSPNGGELINQENCEIRWDSKDVGSMEILLLVYDANKNQLLCYHNPIGTGFVPFSEIPIAVFKRAVRAEDGYYLASFKQELEENCSFVRPVSYYKIKLQQGDTGKITDTSNGYFTISPAPDIKIISAGDEIQLRGRVNPLNWENRTFTIGNDIILADNSTEFYLDGKETTFEKLKQIYDEMGENKYCPFGSCPFNSLNGNIKEITLQGQITIMAEEMFFSSGQ